MASILSVASVVLAVAGQHHIGQAWRTSIDPGHPALLVTTGPFRVVRNPTYTSLLAATDDRLAAQGAAPDAGGQ